MLLAKLSQLCVRHTGDFAWRQRRDAVIHGLDKKTMKVDEISGNVDGSDLSRSLVQHLLPQRISFEYERTLGRAVTFADDILVWTDVTCGSNRSRKNSLFLIGEVVAEFNLPDQILDHFWCRMS